MAVLSIIFSLNGGKQWALRGLNLTVIRVERYIEIELNMCGTVKTKSNKPPKYPGKSSSLHLHTRTPQKEMHTLPGEKDGHNHLSKPRETLK